MTIQRMRSSGLAVIIDIWFHGTCIDVTTDNEPDKCIVFENLNEQRIQSSENSTETVQSD